MIPDDENLTVPDLAAVERRAAAATEGPWLTYAGTDGNGNSTRGVTYERNQDEAVFEDRWCGPADAEFIAHARTDVPALVARVRELEAQRDAAGQIAPLDPEQRASVFASGYNAARSNFRHALGLEVSS